MVKLNIQYVSEIINNDHLTKWKDGDVITIESQTNTGKTTFIINKLLDTIQETDSMIYICNRKKLTRDIKIELLKKYELNVPSNLDDLDKIKVIKGVMVTTYQAVVINKSLDLNSFKYIVCDECHYFLTDSGYNNKTDIAFNKLIRTRYNDCVRIFISGTMDEIKGAIEKGIRSGEYYSYNGKRDYSYLITKYFQHDDDIVQLIKNDKSDDKWIIFVKSIAQGEKIEEKLTEANIDNIFVHAQSLIDPIVDEQFNEKVLIATKFIDNGINIQDDNVKHMVVNAIDRTTFLQEIGRIRVNNDDARMINLYIPMTYPKTWLSYLNTTYASKTNQIKLFRNDYEAFQSKYEKDYKKLWSDIFYLDENNNWKINTLGHWRLEKDIDFANEMYKKLKDESDFAYIFKQLDWIEMKDTFNSKKLIKDVVDMDEVITLEKYLDSIVGKKLFKEEQQELIEAVGLKDARGRIQKSYKQMNLYFEENKIPYIIIPKKSGSTRFWMINTIDR